MANDIPHTEGSAMATSTGAVLPPGRLLIGDRLLDRTGGGTTEHVNPATGKAQATVPLAGSAEVDQAVAAAREGFQTWRAMAAASRREVLAGLTALVSEHGEQFTSIAALESGMPVVTGGGLELATEWMRYYTGWADKTEGQVVSIPTGGLDYVLAEPYGVVAVIIPWNFTAGGDRHDRLPGPRRGQRRRSQAPGVGPVRGHPVRATGIGGRASARRAHRHSRRSGGR
jgi:hypothetical protein